MSAWLLAGLERPFAVVLPVPPPSVDAIVVLGGMAAGSRFEPTGFKTDTSFDRVTTGLALVDRGWCTNLVLGGGMHVVAGKPVHASEALSTWLSLRLGSAITLRVLPACRNTHEEGLRFGELATRQGWKRIALVTSASHLPRAVAVFRRQGLEVQAVGCDFQGLQALEDSRCWTVLPRVGGLRLAELWAHEVLGRAWYRLRGWAD